MIITYLGSKTCKRTRVDIISSSQVVLERKKQPETVNNEKIQRELVRWNYLIILSTLSKTFSSIVGNS